MTLRGVQMKNGLSVTKYPLCLEEQSYRYSEILYRNELIVFSFLFCQSQKQHRQVITFWL